jgi:alpha-tubulin suppressor-like RCC1 family protein
MGLEMSLPAAAKKILITGTAVCAAGALTFSACSPALAQRTPGTVIEHWGAFGAGGTPNDVLTIPTSLTLHGPVQEVGSSNSTQYALLTNGQVWAWGDGGNGQLGDGGTKNTFLRPVRVQFPAGVTIAFIPTDANPYNSAFAVDTTGHVWAWGLNEGGEFCLGNNTQYLTPVELPFTGVTALAGAANHATYDSAGTLYSCGRNDYGELGNGTTTDSTTPVAVKGLQDSLVTTLIAAWGNTGAVLSNGAYYDWGYDADGQVGNGGSTSVLLPYQVPLSAPVTQVVLGGSGSMGGQSLALLSDGSLWAWGNGEYYQLGNGTQENEPSPVQIPTPGGASYVAIATGGATSYGLSKYGSVWAWGYNADGQVGNGKTNMVEKPVVVASKATQISATARDVVIATKTS